MRAGNLKGFHAQWFSAAMALRPILLAALLTGILFAGCSDGGSDGDSVTTTTSATATTTSASRTSTASSATGTSSASGSSTGPAAANQPPIGVVAASIEQGSIPFNVTFNMTGSDGDGDDLTWTLDADGDGESDAEGTSLPASHVQMYDAEGLYNVTFALSDGKAVSYQNLTINATAAAGGSGPVFEASGSFTMGAPYGACARVAGAPQSLWGTPMTEASIDLPEETIGLPFTAVFTATGEFVGVAAVFWDSADAGLGGFSDMSDTVSGVVPDGTVYVSLSSCGPAVQVSVTITVSAA